MHHSLLYFSVNARLLNYCRWQFIVELFACTAFPITLQQNILPFTRTVVQSLPRFSWTCKYKTVLITHTSSFTEDKSANIWLESEVAKIECPRTNIGPLFRQLEASLLNRARSRRGSLLLHTTTKCSVFRCVSRTGRTHAIIITCTTRYVKKLMRLSSVKYFTYVHEL